MKMTLPFLVVLYLVATMAGCCFTPAPRARSYGGAPGVAPAVAPPVVAPPPPALPATPVTACEVDDAYRANEVAAGMRYPEGAHVLVSGSVHSVSQTFGTMSISPSRCMFSRVRLADDQAAAAAALTRGTDFVADCTIGHYIMGAVFNDCRLQ